jgi:hypothetical protein
MYSVSVPGGDAPSQVMRHDWSFARQLCATHTAIDVQAGSFGQLVASEQQCVATQAAHDEAAVLKIWLAPVQVPPSPTTPVPLSVAVPPPSPCGEAPPPGTGAPQVRPRAGTQGPSSAGFGPLEDEHAMAAASAPARAARLAVRMEESCKAMAIGFLGLWSWRLSSADAWADVSFGADSRDSPTAAHTSRTIERAAACLPLRGPCPIGSN